MKTKELVLSQQSNKFLKEEQKIINKITALNMASSLSGFNNAESLISNAQKIYNWINK